MKNFLMIKISYLILFSLISVSLVTRAAEEETIKCRFRWPGMSKFSQINLTYRPTNFPNNYATDMDVTINAPPPKELWEYRFSGIEMKWNAIGNVFEDGFYFSNEAFNSSYFFQIVFPKEVEQSQNGNFKGTVLIKTSPISYDGGGLGHRPTHATLLPQTQMSCKKGNDL
jgi:hypothetical protein